MAKSTENWDAEIAELRRLEEVIRKSDDDVAEVQRKRDDDLAELLTKSEEDVRNGESIGLRARWESGRRMLTLRGGKKQLPKGLREKLAAALERDGSEVNARIKFAEKYPSEEARSHAVWWLPRVS